MSHNDQLKSLIKKEQSFKYLINSLPWAKFIVKGVRDNSKICDVCKCNVIIQCNYGVCKQNAIIGPRGGCDLLSALGVNMVCQDCKKFLT